MKTQKKVKRKKRQISFTIQLELVSCLFISRFHSLPNESIDHIITRQSIRRKIIQYLQFEQKKSNLSPWMSSTFWHVHIERRKVVWDEHASIDQMIEREKKKKKEINDTKDRSTFRQFWLERELTYEYSVRERSEVSARLDIQIILNAMCHIKFDVNYLLKPFCLFTR